ncbi:MAG: AMP-binding protein, partial [Acidobacteria bacterium]|nr:AMP-binding protein [Acidobacteriota bacterium]
MPALSETQSISSAIEALAARYPARVAVRSPGRVLTYGELDAEANGIAGELLDRGLGVGDRVALRLDGLDRLVPAILGIFKAGGVYVPLDPTFPEARSRFVLDDCGAAFVLTDGGNGIDLSAVRTANSAPGVPISPDALAVIVYTSGSTGEPKGVMQSHASLVSFVRNYAAPLGVTERDRLSMLYSYSFAAANLDILTGLLHGAALCCHPTRQAGVSGLASWIAAERITILHTLPTVFRQLASSLGS